MNVPAPVFPGRPGPDPDDESARTAGPAVPTQRLSSEQRSGRNALDVPLDDDELREETELTVHLMVTANEAASELSQADIDHALGLHA